MMVHKAVGSWKEPLPPGDIVFVSSHGVASVEDIHISQICQALWLGVLLGGSFHAKLFLQCLSGSGDGGVILRVTLILFLLGFFLL